MSAAKKCSKSGISNLNASVCPAPSSSGPKIRRNLNETICAGQGFSIKQSAFVTRKDLENENDKLQLTFAYNEYLQSLMKRMITEEQIKKNKNILEGQLDYYEQLLNDKQTNLDKIIAETEDLRKKEQLIKDLKHVEAVISKTKNIYGVHDMKIHLENLETILQIECKSLRLKNIKPLANQEDYDKLNEVLKKLLSTTEKFVKSGRNFEYIDKLAIAIRHFLEIREKTQIIHRDLIQFEKEAITGMIAKLSDMFAKKYETDIQI